jgi:hypothetical protein
MPSYVLKASPDASEDLYCIYSTIVDAVTVIGTRGDIRQYLLHQDGVNGKPDERLERADQNGSSCLIDSDGTGVWYGWAEESISIREGPGDGELPRKDLSAYLGYMEAHNNEAAAKLVQPVVYEEDE